LRHSVLYIPADVDQQTGIQRVWSIYRPAKVLLGSFMHFPQFLYYVSLFFTRTSRGLRSTQVRNEEDYGRIALGYPIRWPTIGQLPKNRRSIERVWAARGSPPGGRKAPGSKARVRSGCA